MRQHIPIERRMELFRRMCRERGLALTHQREVIYRALVSTNAHPSPELIYEQVREKIPSISLATVYKNIRTFIDSGVVREVSQHHGSQRLEANMEPHYHLVCSECKTILDLEQEGLEPVRIKHRLPPGFRIERLNVEVIGLCAGCSGKRRPANRA